MMTATKLNRETILTDIRDMALCSPSAVTNLASNDTNRVDIFVFPVDLFVLVDKTSNVLRILDNVFPVLPVVRVAKTLPVRQRVDLFPRGGLQVVIITHFGCQQAAHFSRQVSL